MKRTLWSLLVSAAAVFPAVGGRDAAARPVQEAVPAASVAPEAHRVEEQRQVRSEKRKTDETEDAPAPRLDAASRAAPRFEAGDGAAALAPAVPDAIPLALRSLRLPQPRAP